MPSTTTQSSPNAPVFEAIADGTRREILRLLVSGEASVSDLVSHFDVSQPAISQHLRVLREARLVNVRPAGRQRLYSIDPEPLREVAEWIRYFDKFWDQKLKGLGEYLDRKKGNEP